MVMGNMIKVVVFSSKLNNRPTIEVQENATKLEIKSALLKAGIDYSELSFADGMNSQELTRDSSILTSKAGKALLTLSPKRNKAGADLSFSELRNAVKSDSTLKDAFVKRAAELGKNWTQLRTDEMNEVYVKLSRSMNGTEKSPLNLVKEITEPQNTRGLSPEMKAEIRTYVNLILLEKEELEFQAVLDSVEANFTSNDEDGDYDDEDEDYDDEC